MEITRYPLRDRQNRPTRVTRGPNGIDVYSLTDRGSEIHANTFYNSRLRWELWSDLLADNGYTVVGPVVMPRGYSLVHGYMRDGG